MPDPITIIIDQQEQRPWAFDPTRFATETKKLRTGDYTLKGYEGEICVERKSLDDYIQTTISDWIRFRKQLYRMAGFDHALIVVEADIGDLYRVPRVYESEASPESIIGRANGIFLDHGVPVVWWGTRTTCVTMLENFFTLAVRKLGGGS